MFRYFISTRLHSLKGSCHFDMYGFLVPLQTPLSLLQRVQKDGAKVLGDSLKSWKPWMPPKQSQVR